MNESGAQRDACRCRTIGRIRMGSRKFAYLMMAMLAAAPALAATHTWFGTTSDRISDPSNWSGGSPVGDADAVLVFPPEAERFHVVNDVPGLRFRELRFEDSGFELSGAALETNGGTIRGDFVITIACDLRISGNVTVIGADWITLSGSISGSGGMTFENTVATLSGNASNTYEGETLLRAAEIVLEKSNGAIAIAGDVRAEPSIRPSSRVHVIEAEQIANDATLRLPSTMFVLHANETIDALEIDYQVRVGNDSVNPTLTVRTLRVLDGAYVEPALRVADVEVITGGVTVERQVFVDDAGVTLRGSGVVQWSGVYTAQTRIEGVRANLTIPNSNVRMTSGSFEGSAWSISASGGTIAGPAQFATDATFGANVTVIANAIRLNGFLNLGGAKLRTGGALASRVTTIIDNASSQPVSGRFAGLPEGAMVENRYLISYQGGDGNDVTLTEVHRPHVQLTITQEPTPAILGAPFVLRVVATGAAGVPTGSVTFALDDGTELGTATMVNGTASLQLTLHDRVGEVFVRYSGDATYASSDVVRQPLQLRYPAPVIDSIDPPSAPPGKITPVIIRGSNFVPGSTVFSNLFVFRQAQYVSPTELRAIVDLTERREEGGVNVVVFQPDNTPSNVVRFHFTAEVDESEMLQFEETGPVAHVTAGAKTAWLTSMYFEDRLPTHFAADDDRDGIVTWPLAQPNGIFAVVDLANGAFDVRAAGTALREHAPLPPHTFALDANGKFSRFALAFGARTAGEWHILWARAGVGAWHMRLVDGDDLDGTRNDIVFGSVDAMTPYGDSPPHPDGFQRGDVFIAISLGSGLSQYFDARYFAEHLGPVLDDDATGRIEVASRFAEFEEEEQVARVAVMRTGGANGPATVRYSTVSRSAVAGVDFVARSGTLVFAPGELLRIIEVPLIDHGGYRDFRGMFNVVLSDATGAILGEETITAVRVTSRDPKPFVQIASAAERVITETDGPQELVIELRLQGPTELPATIAWEVNGGESGEVTFAPGEFRKSVVIAIPGDDDDHGDAFQLVDFTVVANATLIGPTSILIRVIEDDAPTFTPIDVSVDEKDGTARPGFEMSPPGFERREWETFDVTATGDDYVRTFGEMFFTPDSGSAHAHIEIVDDDALEGDETFVVRAHDVEAMVTIRDDELTLRPLISIANITAAEPLENGAAVFEVKLSAASTFPITVKLHTIDGTAIAGADYQLTRETLVFEPDETSKQFVVALFGDAQAEEDEVFSVRIGHMLNGQVLQPSATATILRNEPQPRRTRAVGH